MSHHETRRQRTSDRDCAAFARRLLRALSVLPVLGLLGVFGAGLLPAEPALSAPDEAASVAPQPIKADIPELEDCNDTDCGYWRYCATDGYICTCCGGTVNSCPPGAPMSPVTWTGVCTNPADGKDYIISYNDCCGKSACGNCFCNTNEGDRPVYVPPKSNDINWCTDTDQPYHCTTAVVIGVAVE